MIESRAIVTWITTCVLMMSSAAGPARATTSEELLAELRKLGAPEAARMAQHPMKIEESRPAFLGGAQQIIATVYHPNHPYSLIFIRTSAGGLHRLSDGKAEVERFQREAKLDLRTPDLAADYAKWFLLRTEGPAFWPVSSLEEVPFLPQDARDPDRAKQLEKAKAEIGKKIAPASATPTGTDHTIVLTAVKDRDLLRYEVIVSPSGVIKTDVSTLARDLPVVYVTP